MREYLQFQGFSESDLLAFKAPAGLDIQARRGDEIALSIMAEIVQKRRNAELLDLALLRDNEAVDTLAETTAETKIEVPVDPQAGSSCGCGSKTAEPAPMTKAEEQSSPCCSQQQRSSSTTTHGDRSDLQYVGNDCDSKTHL